MNDSEGHPLIVDCFYEIPDESDDPTNVIVFMYVGQNNKGHNGFQYYDEFHKDNVIVQSVGKIVEHLDACVNESIN